MICEGWINIFMIDLLIYLWFQKMKVKISFITDNE